MDKLIIITALSFKCVEKKNDKFRLIKFSQLLFKLTSSRPRGFSSVLGLSGSGGLTLLWHDVVQPYNENKNHRF